MNQACMSYSLVTGTGTEGERKFDSLSLAVQHVLPCMCLLYYTYFNDNSHSFRLLMRYFLPQAMRQPLQMHAQEMREVLKWKGRATHQVKCIQTIETHTQKLNDMLIRDVGYAVVMVIARQLGHLFYFCTCL